MFQEIIAGLCMTTTKLIFEYQIKQQMYHGQANGATKLQLV
jgi:hypothetical protein